MSSDQDNGIVYEHIASMTYEEAQSRMAELAQAINSHLEQIGYPPCDGNVLAGNSFWIRTAEEWKETFLHWAEERTFETVRNLLIVADARMICGNVDTAAHLTSAHSACIQSYHTVLLPRMLENTLRHKVLIGMFGNWLREPYGEDTGSIDIKYGAYLPMVNAIRLLALGEQIGAASTLERIRKLEEAGVVSTMTAEDWKHAFRTILEIRSMIPACTDKGYYYNRGKLPSAKLTKAVKKELRQALRIGASMQKCVRRTFARERRI